MCLVGHHVPSAVTNNAAEFPWLPLQAARKTNTGTVARAVEAERLAGGRGMEGQRSRDVSSKAAHGSAVQKRDTT